MRHKILILFLIVPCLFTSVARAQTAKPVTPAKPISLEDLKKYAIAFDSINKLSVNFSEKTRKLASGDAKISAERYRQLIIAKPDSVKFKNAKPTEYELAYLKKADQIAKEESSKFRHDSEYMIDYVGRQVFMNIGNQLKTDTKLKHQYDSIVVTLKPIKK